MKNKIDTFCKCIQNYEGYFPPSKRYPHGTPAWRNNNPGNLRFVGQPTATGKDKSGFCIFPSYEVGFQALRQMVTNVCTGKSRVYKKTDTIKVFFSRYAPSSDNNNPDAYARWVASQLKLPVETQMQELLK